MYYNLVLFSVYFEDVIFFKNKAKKKEEKHDYFAVII
jgi:hypothetical protein